MAASSLSGTEIGAGAVPASLTCTKLGRFKVYFTDVKNGWSLNLKCILKMPNIVGH